MRLTPCCRWDPSQTENRMRRSSSKYTVYKYPTPYAESYRTAPEWTYCTIETRARGVRSLRCAVFRPTTLVLVRVPVRGLTPSFLSGFCGGAGVGKVSYRYRGCGDSSWFLVVVVVVLLRWSEIVSGDEESSPRGSDRRWMPRRTIPTVLMSVVTGLRGSLTRNTMMMVTMMVIMMQSQCWYSPQKERKKEENIYIVFINNW